MSDQCSYTENGTRCTKGADHAPAGHVMTGTYNPADPHHTHRVPYVGEGADGARRSANIDLSEADTLPTGPHDPFWTPATEQRRNELIASADRWQAQAADLEAAAVLAASPDAATRAEWSDPTITVAPCVTCGHPDPHTGGGIGVCLHKDCGCDGPVVAGQAVEFQRISHIPVPRNAVEGPQYDNPEPLNSEVPWVPPGTVEASITRNLRANGAHATTLELTYYDLLNQLVVQAGGKHNLDYGCGFEVTLTVKAWKHPSPRGSSPRKHP